MVITLVPWYLYWCHGIYIGAIVIYIGALVFILEQCIYICATVFILVPWYSYWCHGFVLVLWYLYWWHGIYIGAKVFILVPWHLYWCHGIYIGAMVFISVLWYLYWCYGIYIGAIVRLQSLTEQPKVRTRVKIPATSECQLSLVKFSEAWWPALGNGRRMIAKVPFQSVRVCSRSGSATPVFPSTWSSWEPQLHRLSLRASRHTRTGAVVKAFPTDSPLPAQPSVCCALPSPCTGQTFQSELVVWAVVMC